MWTVAFYAMIIGTFSATTFNIHYVYSGVDYGVLMTIVSVLIIIGGHINIKMSGRGASEIIMPGMMYR